MSVRALVLAVLVVLAALGSAGARASSVLERRFAVVIGNDIGQGADVPLRFAERDARKVADTLVRVGGFDASDVVTVVGSGVDEARRAVIAVNDRARQSSRPALLFVYYSGHADAEALHLGADRLRIAELEGLVRGSAAGFRVLVVDACRSGTVTAVKGGRAAPLFDLPGAVPAGDAPAAEGYVVLTAAAAGEDAQESETLRGSFFTHHLVSGLLGAADDDRNGEITLEEAYRHAFHETVRASSTTLAGTQHPTFRWDVRGKGDIVLTSFARAARAAATLVLPAGVDVLLFRDDAGDVAAEVKAGNVARRVAVAPGRYVVRARAPTVLYEGPLLLEAGAEVTVDLSTLARTEYARLVRKGGGARSFVLQPRLGVWGHTPWFDGGGVCNGGFVALPLETQYVSIAPRLSMCGARWQNAFLVGDDVETGLDVAIGHSFDLPWVSLSTGAFGGAALLVQRFTTTGAAPATSTLLPVFGVVLGAVAPLPWGLYATALIEGRSTVTPQLASAEWRPALALGWQVGVGASL